MAEAIISSHIIAASKPLDRGAGLAIPSIPQLLLDLSVPPGCAVMFVRAHPEAQEVLAMVAPTRQADEELVRQYCGELSLCGAVPVYVYGIVPPQKSR